MKKRLIAVLISAALAVQGLNLPLFAMEVPYATSASSDSSPQPFTIDFPSSAFFTNGTGEKALEGYFSVPDPRSEVGKAVVNSKEGFTVLARVWIPSEAASSTTGNWENNEKYNTIACLGDNVLGLRVYKDKNRNLVTIDGWTLDERYQNSMNMWNQVSYKITDSSFYDQWHDIALVGDCSTLTLIIDGTAQESIPASRISSEYVNYPFSVGFDPSIPERTSELKFSSVNLFSKALSLDEISATGNMSRDDVLLSLDFQNGVYKKNPNLDFSSSSPDNPSGMDLKEYYKPLIEDNFKINCHQLLTNEANFTATLLVSEKDKKFSTEVVSAMAHCYFGGIEGWEEQFLKTGSKKESIDILLGLIDESASNLEKVEYANKRIKYANKLMKALKLFQAGQMREHLEDANLLSKLGDKLDTYTGDSAFLNALYSQDVDKIRDFLTDGTNLSKSKVQNFIDTFFDSSDYLDVIQDGLKYLGHGMKIMGATAKILDRICYLDALASVDQIYFKYLDAVAEHSHYEPMKSAALEVRHALDSEYNSACFVLKEAIIDGGNFIVEEVIDKATSAFSVVKLAKTAYDLGSLTSNLLFGISSKQEAYDKLRSIAYMNQAGLYFCQMNRTEFYSVYFEGDEEQIQDSAEKYLGGLNLLASGRISGEKILQNYLNGSGLFGWVGRNDELIRTSKIIQNAVEVNKEYFDLQGKGKKYLSAVVACPVTLELLNQNGSSLIKLQDQIVDPSSKEGIHYSVTKYASGNDFLKAVSFPEDLDLNLQITGTGTGSVDYMIAQVDDNGRLQIRSINNVPVSPDDRIQANSVKFQSDLLLIRAKDNSSEMYRPALATSEHPKEVSSVTVSPNRLSLQIGQTSRLNSIVTPSDATSTDVYWKSSDENVATIDRNGIVKAIAPGEVTITAETFNGKTDSVVITIPHAVSSSPISMHRLYNPNSGEHFYTASDNEKNFLVSVGWNDEGEGWKAPETSSIPVYRLYNENAGDHHYTLNETEKNYLVSVGWKDEGIGWYSDDAKSVPLYRQYNPNAKTGSHNYTPNKKEHNFLVSNGWNDEGIAWYGVK